MLFEFGVIFISCALFYLMALYFSNISCHPQRANMGIKDLLLLSPRARGGKKHYQELSSKRIQGIIVAIVTAICIGMRVFKSVDWTSQSRKQVRKDLRREARRHCLRHITHKQLPSLVKAISQDPERNGLIPLNFNVSVDFDTDLTTARARPGSNKKTAVQVEQVGGLDLTTFRGKQIAMIGDSTLWYPTKWLYPMLFGDNNSFPYQFDTMALSEASKVVKNNMSGKLGLGVNWVNCCDPPLPIVDGLDGTVSNKMYLIQTCCLFFPHFCLDIFHFSLCCPRAPEN